MENVNTQIYDKLVHRSAMSRLYENTLNKKINSLINDHIDIIDKIVKRSSVNDDRQVATLQMLIDKQIQQHYINMHSTTSRGLIDYFLDQASYSFQVLENIIGDIFRLNKPTRRVAEDIVLNKPIYKETTLLAGWSAIATKERQKIDSIIRAGVARGDSEEKIALAIRQVDPFKISRNQSRGLARTAMTSIYAQADREVYVANKKVLKGWQYIAVLDSRTTPLCAHRNGKIYPIEDFVHLPPAHWFCRSTTSPIVKSYNELLNTEGINTIRKRNLEGIPQDIIDAYDGMTPLGESYNDWLKRQTDDVVLKHLGDSKAVDLFRSGKLSIDKFNDTTRTLNLKELRAVTDDGLNGDTLKFADAKSRLDSLNLGVARPEELYESREFINNLREYYLLQVGDLEGVLSYTNYRGTLLHTKKATRKRVLSSPPTEDNLKFNPITNRYEDSRLYQPNPAVLENNLRLVNENSILKQEDKDFINKFIDSLEMKMSVNERAAVADNLRIVFTRFRNNKEPWGNFKAVLNSQMKFDVMNTSDYIETQLRKDNNLLKRLQQMEFIDPVLGNVNLDEIHDSFIKSIEDMRYWEYNKAPKIARKLRNVVDFTMIPPKVWIRLEEADIQDFYLKFAKRLSMMDTPDRDQLAISLGRDLYNLANYRGSRNEWYNAGVKLLDAANDKGFYKLETFGVQKRRMKSRNGNRYFGPYYDTFSVNLRVVDPDILNYAKLVRQVDVGLRVGVTTNKNQLKIREGFKTYFTQDNIDTGIPITSVSSFHDFPAEMIDANMTNALNWAAKSEFKVDEDFHDFIVKLLNFKDDKGKSEYYDKLNEYRKYIVSRGDSYERFAAMRWLRDKKAAFSNHPFLDHRGRIYERGFIGPQAGETFRPFLNTAVERNFSVNEFYNMQDQIGSFLGGLSDKIEGQYNSLSQTGRQGIAEKYRKELVSIGNMMLRGKPQDIRNILEHPLMLEIDGEEQGKFLRLAIEMAKISNYLGGDFSSKSLVRLKEYKISLALEQDASSSGAQIIALTTKNKQLAELSNVVPTNQKRRLYDEIAASTYRDPRFIELNKRLGLTEKDLRKAAKAQNMVTFKCRRCINRVNSGDILIG